MLCNQSILLHNWTDHRIAGKADDYRDDTVYDITLLQMLNNIIDY